MPFSDPVKNLSGILAINMAYWSRVDRSLKYRCPSIKTSRHKQCIVQLVPRGWIWYKTCSDPSLPHTADSSAYRNSSIICFGSVLEVGCKKFLWCRARDACPPWYWNLFQGGYRPVDTIYSPIYLWTLWSARNTVRQYDDEYACKLTWPSFVIQNLIPTA